MRILNQAGIDLIKSFEGFSADPYQDQVGVWTIGYGHTSGVTADSASITEDQAVVLLQQDVADAITSIENNITAVLTDNQFAALVSLVYNVGSAPLRGTLGTALNAGQYSFAANQFGRWVYSGHQQIEGLVRRREAERELFVS